MAAIQILRPNGELTSHDASILSYLGSVGAEPEMACGRQAPPRCAEAKVAQVGAGMGAGTSYYLFICCLGGPPPGASNYAEWCSHLRDYPAQLLIPQLEASMSLTQAEAGFLFPAAVTGNFSM